MQWIGTTYEDYKNFFNDLTIVQIKDIIQYTQEFIDNKYDIEVSKKQQFVELMANLFSNSEYIYKFYEKLSSTNQSNRLYNKLIWESDYVDTKEAIKLFDLKLQNKSDNISFWGTQEESLVGIYSFIVRKFSYRFDILEINQNIKTILKFVFPIPNDYILNEIKDEPTTKYSYNNEQGIFDFLDTIESLLDNHLVEFGKTNEKPLLKTIKLLKESSSSKEFYTTKTIDTISTDMLTRLFSYYYWDNKGFKKNRLDALKTIIIDQLNDIVPFYISRIFTAHLKKVKFDNYYRNQGELFGIFNVLFKNIPPKSWISVENIINFCKYRDLKFHYEGEYKTNTYFMICDILQDDKNIKDEINAEGEFYYSIFFEPILKGLFFYLGSLGLLELKYNDPVSKYNITAHKKNYISIFDGLEYIKFSKLGLYIFGMEKKYQIQKVKKIETSLKFDIYKPIITVNNKDTIMLAKIEPYTEKYDENRYILSYSKIFRDCKDIESLKIKIDGFYKNIEAKPPQVFSRFFDEILKNANMLKHEQIYHTIELVNNKKLLNLFMTNKKLQELTIKAQGYKVLVLKKDLAKLTKIVKDNGFFVEF